MFPVPVPVRSARTSTAAAPPADYVNGGTINVSADVAVAVSGSGPVSFDNRGTIVADGVTTGEAVHWDDAAGSLFVNSGSIQASTSLASPNASIGLFLGEATAGGATIVRNNGTIEADVAIFASDFATATLFSETVQNSGRIAGDIILGLGGDAVENGGTIAGRILLGEGNDIYVGSNGGIDGAVEGGAGNDDLAGGALADTLYGDGGDDVLAGGGGDDLLDGGWGSDRLDGGAGSDTLSYAGGPAAVLVDLAAGTAFDGGHWDQLAGFEQVVGSRFDDVVRGGAAGETLRGLDGSDRIDGGAGDDVLRGDGGDDLLSAAPATTCLSSRSATAATSLPISPPATGSKSTALPPPSRWRRSAGRSSSPCSATTGSALPARRSPRCATRSPSPRPRSTRRLRPPSAACSRSTTRSSSPRAPRYASMTPIPCHSPAATIPSACCSHRPAAPRACSTRARSRSLSMPPTARSAASPALAIRAGTPPPS